MNGDLVPESDVWVFDGTRRQRKRQEYSPLTIGMWSIIPYVLNEPDWRDYRDVLISFYKPNSTYWGKIKDNEGEDIEHNEMYFDQFLAWFGGIMQNGTWTKPKINLR
jgi:hypothetical protein